MDSATAAVFAKLSRLGDNERRVVLDRLEEQGFWRLLEHSPERLDMPSRLLTSKQRQLWMLDADEHNNGFYHCSTMWLVSARATACEMALCDVMNSSEVFHRRIEGHSELPVFVDVDPPPVQQVAPPRHIVDPLPWCIADAARRHDLPVLTAGAVADVVVYKLDSRRSVISLVGHDAYFDHQGLRTVLAPAVGRRLVGGRVQEGIRLSDFAHWQDANLKIGPLGRRVERRRGEIAAMPPAPLEVTGDRTGVRHPVWTATPERQQHIRDRAANAGVSSAALLLAIWQFTLSEWNPAFAAVPIGSCTTARVRPELRDTLGNLANTCVVVPPEATDELQMQPLDERRLRFFHRALQATISDVDLPFEMVFPARHGHVEDEQIGVRYTFVEYGEPTGMLNEVDVPVQTAKSALGCEVRWSHAGLEIWLDTRPSAIRGRDAARLAEMMAGRLEEI